MGLIHTGERQGPIRMVAVMEATTVTGPAKNLIGFCRRASRPDTESPDLPLVEPSVLTFIRGSAAPPNQFISALTAAGVSFATIQERFRFDPQAVAQLRSRILSFQPDVVQTHSVKSHFLLWMSGLHRHYPWIAFHHGYTATDLKMKAYNQLDRWSLRAARAVITVCGPFAEELARAGVPRSKIRILHNSVQQPERPDPQAIDALRQRLGLNGKDSVVLAVGRFSHEKGLADLIAAFAGLRRLAQERKTRLVLVGDGPERANLQSAIDSLGLAGQVIMAGQVSDVQPYYGLASILALPSHSEGSPNVILEAMAAGVPIAATAVGGVPELLTDEVTGLLVEPRAPDQMAGALNRLLSDEALGRRMAERAALRIASEFQPENYRRSLVNLYREIIS
jgi:glycosyltransferase involved in cell wall biosynthesis